MLVYAGIVAGIFTGELLLKNYIENRRKEGEITKKCKGRLWIRKYHNYGAFLNLLERKKGIVKVVSILFCILLTAFFILTLGKSGSAAMKTGLAFLLGGAFSNTYDRMKRGYVVDYFSIHLEKGPLKGISKVVFNIADFCIMIGAMVVVLNVK